MPDRLKPWLSRGVAIIVGAALLLVVALLALHTAPARNVVLRRAVLFLADRFDLVLNAENLHYNLVTRRLSLSRVTLAATHSPEDPVFGRRFDRSHGAAGSVLRHCLLRSHLDRYLRLAIHRSAERSSNLPSGDSSGDDAFPQPLPSIDSRFRSLPSTYRMATADCRCRCHTSPLMFVLETGELRLVDSGRLSWGSETATVKAFGGGVAFDSRAIRLSRFSAITDEAEMTLDGQIALLVSSPNLDVRLSGRGDVAELARSGDTRGSPCRDGGFRCEGQRVAFLARDRLSSS